VLKNAHRATDFEMSHFVVDYLLVPFKSIILFLLLSYVCISYVIIVNQHVLNRIC